MIKKQKVVDINHQGYGIIRLNSKVIFVKDALPGDIVDIEIVKNYRKYSLASVVNYVSKTDEHSKIICPYYDRCGGCQISHIKQKSQLEFKVSKVKNIFKKYLDLDINPKIVNDKFNNYRNKVVFHVCDNVIGFYEEESNKLVSIDKCLLLDKRINDLIPLLNKLDLSFVEKIMVRVTSKEIMVVFYGYIDKIDILKDRVDSIILINIKEKLLYGKSYIKEQIDDYRFIISYNSFFQVNTNVMKKLYKLVRKYADLKKEDNVLDLYCGTGTIGIYLAKDCNSVTGIEIVENAICDANINKELNNIDNISFVCGDVSRLINDNYNCNIVVVDPPRSGLDKNTKKVLLDNNYEKIVYVSCDPMTLVRDIKDLSNKYELKDITVFDMFPNTYHCEVVTILNSKEKEKRNV